MIGTSTAAMLEPIAAPPPTGVRGDSPVLVVDDSVLSQRLAGSLIEKGMGKRVVFAKHGAEALALLDTVEPGVILTDIHMPIMDGFELVEAVRAKAPHIPIVLMTAYGSEAVAMRALKAGAANYVPKHFLVSELVDTLRQILGVVESNQRRRQVLACQSSRSSTFEMSPDPDLMAPLVGLVKEELIGFGIGDETARMRVAVAFQEALANALYHGNLECSTELRQVDEQIFYNLADERRSLEPFRSRRVHVATRVDREGAKIVIRDEGPGFNVADLDKPFDPEDLMRVGGRGMILIRTFLDEVHHNDKGNEITLIKRR